MRECEVGWDASRLSLDLRSDSRCKASAWGADNIKAFVESGNLGILMNQ